MSRLADGLENLERGNVNPTKKMIDPNNLEKMAWDKETFQGTDDELIDIHDRIAFFDIKPNGKVFHCALHEGETLTLRYGI